MEQSSVRDGAVRVARYFSIGRSVGMVHDQPCHTPYVP